MPLPHALLAALTLATAQEPPPVALEGRVVDLLGEPLRVAEVRVTAPGSDEVLARGFTDGEGRFRLGRVPPREVWHVHAALAGYGRAAAKVAAAMRGRFLELELAPAARVRGAVRDADGGAVAAAVVRALALGAGEVACHVDAVTDADGAFELRDVGFGPNRLVVFVPDTGFVAQDLVVAGDAEVVLSAVRQPAKAPMLVRVEGVRPADLSRIALTCAVRHGSCLLPLPPPHDALPFGPDGTLTLAGAYDGPLAVTVIAPGHVLSPRTRWFDRSQSVDELAFDATPLGDERLVCRGVLRQADDAPLPGIDLELAAPDGTARAIATSRPDGAVVFHSLLAPGEKCVVRSLDDRWVVEPLVAVPGRHPDFLQCTTTVQPQRELALRATPAAVVTGRVRTADGEPARGLVVHLEELIPNIRWIEVATAVTDADGGYRCAGIHPKSGSLRLRVADRRGVGTSAPFPLAGKAPVAASCDLALEAAFVVEGVLRDADGAPVAGATVSLAQDRRGLLVRTDRLELPPPRVTDRAGRFRFPVAPPGRLLVSTRGARSEPFVVEGKGPHEVELLLTR